MILTNKLKSYGGDVQLHLYEDDIQTVHTIPSRNGTIGAGVFNKIPNTTTSWNGPKYKLILSTCKIMYNNSD